MPRLANDRPYAGLPEAIDRHLENFGAPEDEINLVRAQVYFARGWEMRKGGFFEEETAYTQTLKEFTHDHDEVWLGCFQAGWEAAGGSVWTTPR